jgi:hypothetical protein
VISGWLRKASSLPNLPHMDSEVDDLGFLKKLPVVIRSLNIYHCSQIEGRADYSFLILETKVYRATLDREKVVRFRRFVMRDHVNVRRRG